METRPPEYTIFPIRLPPFLQKMEGSFRCPPFKGVLKSILVRAHMVNQSHYKTATQQNRPNFCVFYEIFPQVFHIPWDAILCGYKIFPTRQNRFTFIPVMVNRHTLSSSPSGEAVSPSGRLMRGRCRTFFLSSLATSSVTAFAVPPFLKGKASKNRRTDGVPVFQLLILFSDWPRSRWPACTGR